jgi:hypothetical protein
MVLEAPPTVAAGGSRLRLQVGHHGTIFDGDFASGNLRLRTGLNGQLEIAVDGSVINPLGSTCPGHNIYLGRLGLKRAVSSNFALTAGAGGGYSAAAGTMASADAGLSIGYHNRYAVPYLSASGFASVPARVRPVRTGSEPEDVDTPTRTLGAQISVGLSLLRERYTLSLGLDSGYLWDDDGDQHVLSVGLGVEISLD